MIAPRDRPAAGGGVRKTQPWFSAWVIQSADGYQYVFDTNGVRADTLTLMASSRGWSAPRTARFTPPWRLKR